MPSHADILRLMRDYPNRQGRDLFDMIDKLSDEIYRIQRRLGLEDDYYYNEVSGWGYDNLVCLHCGKVEARFNCDTGEFKCMAGGCMDGYMNFAQVKRIVDSWTDEQLEDWKEQL